MTARRLLVAAAVVASFASPAQAWFHGTSSRGGGTYDHTSWNGDRSTSVSASGWSHSADYGYQDRSSSGNWQGSASRTVTDGAATRSTSVSPSGWDHSSDYGGYYHGTSGNWNGTATHTGYYGTTTASTGAYYHQPAAVPYYGAGCYNCGAPAWGAAAAGAAVGAAAGVAVGAAAAASAPPPPPPPPVYAALPPGCAYRPLLQRYECPGPAWFTAAYGANGLTYRPVPPP